MFYFDTYAIIEIINGNMNYEKYKNQKIITCTLNLAELYWVFLNKYNRKTADYWIRNLSFDLIKFSEIECMEATRYRHSRKKSKLSFIDCLGYILGLKNNLKFLTGDKEFEKEPNTEFVIK